MRERAPLSHLSQGSDGTAYHSSMTVSASQASSGASDHVPYPALGNTIHSLPHFAASASTVDLIHLVPGPLTPKDHWWEHTASSWWFDMAMLTALSIGYLLLVRWKIRLKTSR